MDTCICCESMLHWKSTFNYESNNEHEIIISIHVHVLSEIYTLILIFFDKTKLFFSSSSTAMGPIELKLKLKNKPIYSQMRKTKRVEFNNTNKEIVKL